MAAHKKISRRDFLKLGAGFLQASLTASLVSGSTRAGKIAPDAPNIVVLVCDAMAARDLSLYGFARKTTPNLERLANQAFVYHQHYSPANYTTPGVASLLTGLIPLSHRAVALTSQVRKELTPHNIFRLLGDGYYKTGFSQNYLANYLLAQFTADLDELLPVAEFSLTPEKISGLFKNDLQMGVRATDKIFYYDHWLLLSFLAKQVYQPRVDAALLKQHPLGLPAFADLLQFTMAGLFSGMADKITELDALDAPFFSYFHVFPPHAPYRPTREFAKMFRADNLETVEKPLHELVDEIPASEIVKVRKRYDGFIANLDFEIGRLIATLTERKILDRTYFIITSDHGEIFERGVMGHRLPILYDPVVRVPLLILAPGNTARRDFHVNTSGADLLPTLLKIAGREIPASAEGRVLPGFGVEEDPRRSIFIVEASQNSSFVPFTRATYALVKENYKLHYYQGYDGRYNEFFELYDLRQDPEEINNLYTLPAFAGVAAALKQELFAAIDAANKKL